MKKGRSEQSEPDFLISFLHFKIHHQVNLLLLHQYYPLKKGRSEQSEPLITGYIIIIIIFV